MSAARIRARMTWHSIFEKSLEGAAVFAKDKAVADELVTRARMLADQAERAVLEHESAKPVFIEDEPFSLVRRRSPELGELAGAELAPSVFFDAHPPESTRPLESTHG